MAYERVDPKGYHRIKCKVCNGWFHSLTAHLVKKHKMAPEDYLNKFGDKAPLVSEYARERMAAKKRAHYSKKRKIDQINESSTVEPSTDTEAEKDESVGQELYFGPVKINMRGKVSEYDSEFVPSHDEYYKLNMDQLIPLAIGVSQSDNVLMVGPTGCGKTTLIRELASILNQPFKKYNLNGQVKVAHFLGEKTLEIAESGQTSVVVWMDGVLPQAMRRGWWLLLDEMDMCPPQILSALQGVLEEDKILVIMDNQGEVVKPDPNFRIFATANTLGKGDDSGLYAGTNILNEAYLDRFQTIIECDYLDHEAEIDVLVAKTGIDKTQASKMVDVAGKVRLGFKKDECYSTFSTRKLLSWAAKTVICKDIVQAAKVAVLNRLPRDDREFVANILQRIFSGSFK